MARYRDAAVRVLIFAAFVAQALLVAADTCISIGGDERLPYLPASVCFDDYGTMTSVTTSGGSADDRCTSSDTRGQNSPVMSGCNQALSYTFNVTATGAIADNCLPKSVSAFQTTATTFLVQGTCAIQNGSYTPLTSSTRPLADGSVTVAYVHQYTLLAPSTSTFGNVAFPISVKSTLNLDPTSPFDMVGVGGVVSTLQLGSVGQQPATPATVTQWLPYADQHNGPTGPSGYLSPWSAVNGSTWSYGHNKAKCFAVPLMSLYPSTANGSGSLRADDHSSTYPEVPALTLLLDPYSPTPSLTAAASVMSSSDDDSGSSVSVSLSRGSLRLVVPGANGTAPQPLVLSTYLVLHPPSIQASLDVYSSMWPELFVGNTTNSNVDAIGWGGAVYADYRAQTNASIVNTTLLGDLGLSFNWDATFPFPYWGQWLGFNGSSPFNCCTAIGHVDPASGVDHPEQEGVPPPGVPALPGTGACETIDAAADVDAWYAAAMNRLGMAVLAYGNLMEWGYQIETNTSVDLGCDAGNTTAYCIANTLWRGENALYPRQPFSKCSVGGGDYSAASDWINGGSVWDQKAGTWPISPGVKVMDPLCEPYHSFTLAQIAQQVAQTPHLAGVCMDRSDHLHGFNAAGDDGYSWTGNTTAAFIGHSYGSIVNEIRLMLHGKGLSLWASPTAPRIDLVGLYDGIYDEFGDTPVCAALDGYMSLNRPAAAWYASPASLHGSPPVEQYLQTAILNGLPPTVPWVLNDHAITGVEAGQADPYPVYYAYAPIYKRITHKRWLLTHRAVSVTAAAGGILNVSSNAFIVGQSQTTVMVVVSAGSPSLAGAMVDIRVNAAPALPAGLPPNGCSLQYPGWPSNTTAVEPTVNSDGSLAFASVSLAPAGFVVVLLQY